MTSDPLEQAIAEFATHLIPEAFDTATCAHRVTLEPVDLSGVGVDDDALIWFDRWMQARLEDALAAAWPHDRPLAVAYVSDGRLLRRYDEPGCGHLQCLTVGVREEVRAVATPWFLGCWLPRPRAVLELTVDHETGVEEEVLVPADHTAWHAWWYAEARGRGVATVRAGMVRMDGERVIGGESVDARATWVGRGFHDVLRGHPSRRRHRLRHDRA